MRQKYGDDMPKHCREALRAIGFEEDRGACAVMECAGSFKYQHDTDKDLKFIHVFPKIDTAAAAAAAPNQQDEEEAEIKVAGMTLDELPPEHQEAMLRRHGPKILPLLRTKWPGCEAAFDAAPAPSV